MDSVTLETSLLGVRDGRVRGVYVEFVSSCAVWNRSCTSVEVPEFGFRYVCGGGAAGVMEKSRRFSVNFYCV